QVARDPSALLGDGELLRLLLQADVLEPRRRLADEQQEELEVVARELPPCLANDGRMPAEVPLDENGCDDERLRGAARGQGERRGDRLSLDQAREDVVAERRPAPGAGVVHQKALRVRREWQRERIDLRDAQTEARARVP